MKTELIVRNVPKKVVETTEWYMRERDMNLYDAFKEAVRETYCTSVRLRHAWFFDDYREYIPSAYAPEYLDFEKYPLRYHV